MPPPRMCGSEVDCGAQASCVAGRCVARGATAAIDTARRLLATPVDVAYLHRGASTGIAAIGTLGAERDPSAMILLRFAVALPAEVSVLEAYLVLERVTDIDADPGKFLLRAARIVDSWDGRAAAWTAPPRLAETGAPVTRVSGIASVLRLDVRSLVQRWRRRRGDDFGIAVVSEGASARGVAFALAPMQEERHDPVLAPAPPPMGQPLSPFEPHPVAAAAVAEPRRELTGPRLELYVR